MLVSAFSTYPQSDEVPEKSEFDQQENLAGASFIFFVPCTASDTAFLFSSFPLG